MPDLRIRAGAGMEAAKVAWVEPRHPFNPADVGFATQPTCFRRFSDGLPFDAADARMAAQQRVNGGCELFYRGAGVGGAEQAFHRANGFFVGCDEAAERAVFAVYVAAAEIQRELRIFKGDFPAPVFVVAVPHGQAVCGQSGGQPLCQFFPVALQVSPVTGGKASEWKFTWVFIDGFSVKLFGEKGLEAV